LLSGPINKVIKANIKMVTEYLDKKNFFMFLEQYIFLVKKVLKTDDTAKIFTEANTYLSFDKNKKKYLDNQKIYIDLTTEYIEESKN